MLPPPPCTIINHISSKCKNVSQCSSQPKNEYPETSSCVRNTRGEKCDTDASCQTDLNYFNLQHPHATYKCRTTSCARSHKLKSLVHVPDLMNWNQCPKISSRQNWWDFGIFKKLFLMIHNYLEQISYQFMLLVCIFWIQGQYPAYIAVTSRGIHFCVSHHIICYKDWLLKFKLNSNMKRNRIIQIWQKDIF